MANIVVGIADMAVGRKTGDILITHSLGSCLGVMIYDPVAKMGGMVHCMLPLSQIDKKKAQANPFMFVDTGVPKLLVEMLDKGCSKKNLVIKAAGAARVLDNKDLFRIGERNYAVFRKILWKNNLLIDAQDVGGSISRTVYFAVDTGQITLKSGREMKTL